MVRISYMSEVDSTNDDVPGFTTSEAEIGPTLEALFGKADKRIVNRSVTVRMVVTEYVTDGGCRFAERLCAG